jgi:hypothetical protein
MKKLIASILLTASAVLPAHADSSNLDSFGYWLHKVKFEGGKEGLSPSDIAECNAIVEKARKDGKKEFYDYAFKQLGYKDGMMTLAQAEGFCREVQFYSDVILKDVAVFSWFTEMTFALMSGTNDMSYYKDVAEHVDACDKAVAALLAAKVDPSTPVTFGPSSHRAKTVGEIKTKLCDAAREASTSIEKARLETAAAERAPFLKVGIKDDKLEFIVKNDGEIYLPGKRQSSNPKDYAKASTLYLWTVREPDIFNYVVNTVYKYVFKGNKLVKESYKTYRLQDGREPPAAAFK